MVTQEMLSRIQEMREVRNETKWTVRADGSREKANYEARRQGMLSRGYRRLNDVSSEFQRQSGEALANGYDRGRFNGAAYHRVSPYIRDHADNNRGEETPETGMGLAEASDKLHASTKEIGALHEPDFEKLKDQLETGTSEDQEMEHDDVLERDITR